MKITISSNKITLFFALLFTLLYSHPLYAAEGYTTRYWDGCKPHFSWSDNANGEPVKTCNINNELNPLSDNEISSSCDGGEAYTCWDMAPQEINETLSYGYAAVPANEAENKTCYEITFTGTGKYNDIEPGSVALKQKEKKMIIMAINIGYDVEGGQFDLLIPGGGVGIFDAFSNQLGVSSDQLGAQYGGFLSSCQAQYGYNDTDTLKSCVQNMCNTIFDKAGMEDLKSGCNWYVDWYEMADNPNINYEETSCPAALLEGAFITEESSDDNDNSENTDESDNNDDQNNNDSDGSENSDNTEETTNNDEDNDNTTGSGGDDESNNDSDENTDSGNTEESNNNEDNDNTTGSGSEGESDNEGNENDEAGNTGDTNNDENNNDTNDANNIDESDNSTDESAVTDSAKSGGLVGFPELLFLLVLFSLKSYRRNKI